MPVITLKIDVDTWRGTRQGAPNLARLLKKHDANATFLFSLGPDHTGWALRRAFRPGFFQKVARTSVVEHYGLKTLMYGVLLPAPDIGKSCATEMRAIKSAGFECGIHCWDHVRWQDNVRRRGSAWTAKQMQTAFDRFCDIFGEPPRTHGAAGWQMNEHAFAQLDAFDMAYASDGRAMLDERGALVDNAAGPYRIRIGGETLACIQLPTTLPTLDEILGRNLGDHVIDASNAANAILRLTESPRDHVFTLHAELEGQKLIPIFEQLLKGWQAQGYELASMADYHRKVMNSSLPVYPIDWGELPGRSGELIVQPVQAFQIQ
ncbi:MAG TPA: xylanase [Noviherbaspirillum sp.]|uniref:xylanase n=1 Tax=Noviherbaspirillum sp. TaxID=1926288 RepID=UPI002B45D464|nr:xylanase [Noviherbaspirillum sp.]HJV88337.1 xylanase [Noviherbaspirillum sp.]